jgi:hypothetical protein
VNGQYQLLRLEKLVRIDRLLNQSLFHLVESSGTAQRSKSLEIAEDAIGRIPLQVSDSAQHLPKQVSESIAFSTGRSSSCSWIQSGFDQRKNMKTNKLFFTLLVLLTVGILAGCSTTTAKSPDVSDSIRKSLDQAGFKDVSVSQDRDKGIVTLGGKSPAKTTSHKPNHLPSPSPDPRSSRIRLRWFP